MQAYAELLEENDIKIPAWFSFSSKDGVNVVSGDSLLDCASIADSCPKVAAVGINCTPPRFIHALILSARKVLLPSKFISFREKKLLVVKFPRVCLVDNIFVRSCVSSVPDYSNSNHTFFVRNSCYFLITG